MHTTVQELISGILRFFPNSMIVALITLGITMGRITWILVALGGIAIIIFTLLLQYALGKTPIGGMFDLPGKAVIEACSLIPIASDTGNYNSLPSIWLSTSLFFVTYILVNAVKIYTQSPASSLSTASKLSSQGITTPVQQRKGMGLISIVAVCFMIVLLIAPRCFSPCESYGGIALGTAIGVVGGWGWWQLLNACGNSIYPDIHGVQIGLTPGPTHKPLACSL